MEKVKRAAPWVLSTYIAFVFVQSLFFKFAGAEESIHIFQTLEDWSGIPIFEPGLRIGVGVTELIASILLLIPALQVFGAAIAFGVISGAIFFHLFTPLGIEVHGDGGLLFAMAVGVWLASVAIMVMRRDSIQALIFAVTSKKPVSS